MTLIPRSKSSRIYTLVCLIFICLLVLYLRPAKTKTTPASAPTITITKVITKSIAEKITLPGTLVAPVIVKIRPRVDGQIMGVHFQNGDFVKKDQLLFTLDDTLLQAQLAQAEGSLARDKANLQYAESEVKRTRTLAERTYASASKFDQTLTNAEGGKGVLQTSQGMVDQYKTQISYTKIYSPIEGRIGYININEGNYVHATDSDPLATIVQLDPIEIRFALPEKYLTQLQKMDLTQIIAYLSDLNKQPYAVIGHLKALDNQVDSLSGTVLVAASFDNKDHKLLPGQYMTVEFAISQPKQAMILPVEAVQIGQESSYVYLYS
ncbi:MAG: efflux RND transporter periplasmic adaptor subunit [Janthinobacterium lividum]